MAEEDKDAVAAAGSLRAIRLVTGALKVGAIVIGLPLTLFALMSLVGLLSENLWVRLVPAAIVALGVPFITVERLLRRDPFLPSERITEVLALGWLGFAVLFVGLGYPVTRSPLSVESHRLAELRVWEISAATSYITREPLPPRPSSEASIQREASPVVLNDGSPHDATHADVEAGVEDAGRGGEDAAPDGAGDADGGSLETAVPPEELRLPALVESLSSSLVTLSITYGDGSEGYGTAFAVGRGDRLATCLHLIEGATAVAARLANGSWTEEVDLLAADGERDLALLQLDQVIDPLPLVQSELDEDELLYAFGSPLGLEPVVSVAAVSGQQDRSGLEVIELATRPVEATACGPVVTSRSEVVALVPSHRGPLAELRDAALVLAIEHVVTLGRGDHPDRSRIGTSGRRPRMW